jgi:cytochrome b561
MTLVSTDTRYGWISTINHWLTVVLFMATLALGLLMDELPRGVLHTGLRQWHEAAGVLILTLAMLHALWLLISPRPGPVEGSGAPARWLARGVQILLWTGLVGLPLSGWLTAVAGGHAVSVFGWFDLPSLTGRSEGLHEAGEELHEMLGHVLIAAVALHSLAALKHHFIDGDTTLRRMLPGGARD